MKRILPVPSSLSIKVAKAGKLFEDKEMLSESGSADDIGRFRVSPSFMLGSETELRIGGRFTLPTVRVNNTVSVREGVPLSVAITSMFA